MLTVMTAVLFHVRVSISPCFVLFFLLFPLPPTLCPVHFLVLTYCVLRGGVFVL